MLVIANYVVSSQFIFINVSIFLLCICKKIFILCACINLSLYESVCFWKLQIYTSETNKYQRLQIANLFYVLVQISLCMNLSAFKLSILILYTPIWQAIKLASLHFFLCWCTSIALVFGELENNWTSLIEIIIRCELVANLNVLYWYI